MTTNLPFADWVLERAPRSAVELGAITAGADERTRALIAAYGLALGIVFQHTDDLANHDHAAFAVACHRRISELLDEARAQAAQLCDHAARLALLADWVAGLA